MLVIILIIFNVFQLFFNSRNEKENYMKCVDYFYFAIT
jgi:hypothetical protein